jgi:hypothetical protein
VNDIRRPAHRRGRRGREDEFRGRQRRGEERGRRHGDEDLQAGGFLGLVAGRTDGDGFLGPADAGRRVPEAVVSGVPGLSDVEDSRTMTMSTDVRVYCGGVVMVAVVAVEMGVHERRAERPDLQDDRQTRREQPTHHSRIFPAWRGRVNLNSF